MAISFEDRGKLLKEGLAAIGSVPGDVRGKLVNLPKYPNFVSWMVKTYYAEFRRLVVFKEHIWNDAKFILEKLIEVQNCTRESNCTKVFVHMRMEDYSNHLNKMHYGPMGVDVFQKTNYLQEAFKHVRKTVTNPIF